MNHELVEREAFSHSTRIQDTEFKKKNLLKVNVLTALCVSLVQEKTPNCHVVGRVVWKVEMWRNLFGSIFVNFFSFSKLKMFANAVCKYSLTQTFLDSVQLLRT